VAEIVGARGSPLALLAGVHLLELTGQERDPWSRFREVLEARRGLLARFVAEEPVQTNEVQRAWGLLPGFLRAGAPVLDLVELGSSAGLNLLWDRWSYRYGALSWGAEDAPLVLSGEAAGGPPAALLERRPLVRRRLGIDRAPVDVRDEAAALRLQAFVWADQEERLARLRAALEVARREPPELVAGDYLDVLPRVLAERAPDALTVVYNSATTAYLSAGERERLAELIEAAGEEGPLAWLSYEHAGDDVEGAIAFETFALDLRLWPGGEKRRLARLDGHGNRLRWLGS
jgi:hypothetical protein